MELKVTGWYPADVKPVRAGFYQRDYSLRLGAGIVGTPDYWDGKNWFLGFGGVAYAIKPCIENLPWHGLVEDPKTAVTQWFCMGAQPLHVGVYEVECRDGVMPFYARFNGTFWCLTCDSVDNASGVCERSVICYDGTITGWRGLAVQP